MVDSAIELVQTSVAQIQDEIREYGLQELQTNFKVLKQTFQNIEGYLEKLNKNFEFIANNPFSDSKTAAQLMEDKSVSTVTGYVNQNPPTKIDIELDIKNPMFKKMSQPSPTQIVFPSKRAEEKYLVAKCNNGIFLVENAPENEYKQFYRPNGNDLEAWIQFFCPEKPNFCFFVYFEKT